MLTEQAVKNLGYKKQYRYKIKSPAFVEQGAIWNKSKTNFPIPQQILNKFHQFNYYKKGKTFGFGVNRYIEYVDGMLLYFQGENDNEYKGYCRSENLYMYYIPIENQFLLHLTNGTESSQFYFNDNLFYNQVYTKLRKDVIQLNFYQKYSLIELLGKGTYSKVYLAKNKQTGAKFAVKLVGKKDKNGNCTKNLVQEQKKIFGILNTQYACRMEQFFEDDSNFIFVIQLLSGKDFMTFYRQKLQFTLQDLIFIFKGILKGLAYIHTKNIMHRDLKPQNIMINETTKAPKLIDFGLSLLFSPKTDRKKYKRCGTMGYMAYQVINNTTEKKKAYDCKCDIFSFGIVAHMFLLGYNPLKGKNYSETIQKNQECNIVLQKQLIIEKYGYQGLCFLTGLLQKDSTKRLSAYQALNSQFLQQNFNQPSVMLFKSQVSQTTQIKQEQAIIEQQQESIPIPTFQNFVPNKANLENRI